MSPYQILADWLRWFWPLFANHLWQTTLFASIAWAAVLLLNRSTARARYLVWMIAFAKFVLPSSLLIFAMEQSGFNFSMPESTPSAHTGVEILFQIAQPISPIGLEQVVLDSAESIVMASQVIPWTHRDLYFVLGIIWGLGTMAFFARWLVRYWQLARALRSGREVTTGRESDVLNRAKSWLSLTGDIGLITSPQVSEPGVWRIWRPIVVLPEGIAERLSDEELETLMMHELIHISRRDNLLGVLQMLVCCLFWFHPLIWLIDRKLLSEREVVCDESVIHYFGEPQIYAASLWKIAQFGLGWNFAGVSRAAGSNLKRRIELMLDMKRRTKLSLAGRTLAGSAVCTLIVIAFTLAIFTRNKVEASKIPAAQDQQLMQPVPMQYENLPEIPLVVTNLRAAVSEARERTSFGVTPDGLTVRLTHQGEKTRDLQLNVRMLNQGNRAIARFAMKIQTPLFWPGEDFTIVSPAATESGSLEGENGVIAPQGVFTFNYKFSIDDRMDGVELMNSINDFRLKIVGVMFESEKAWIWAPEAQTPSNSKSRIFMLRSKPGPHRNNAEQRGAGVGTGISSGSGIGGQSGAGSGIGQGLGQGVGQGTDVIEPMSVDLRPTILYKEKAKYTDEARNNNVEGIVVLSAVFSANGLVTNINVVRALPDGLTEQAIAAAQKIRFEPAMKDGQRVSVRGNLEYSFSLGESPNKSMPNQDEDGKTKVSDKQEKLNKPEPVYPMEATLRPRILYKEKADYTPEARANGVQGTVVLRAVFGSDGKVAGITVIRGLPHGLTESAIEAAQKIRFEPAIKDGKPVSVRGMLEFTFTL